MSGDEANVTTTSLVYDYSSYYYGDIEDDFAPCQADNVTAFGRVFLPTLYSLVFIFGFVGNGLVVCVLVKYYKQINMTDICLFNLALSDLLFVLTLPLYSHYSAVGVWTFGDIMCRFTSGAHNTGFFSSTFFMVAMTLERYMAIMHTRRVVRYHSLRACTALTTVVWMLSLSVSLPNIIFTTSTNESDGKRCVYDPQNEAWDFYILFAANVLGLMIPLLVMAICYSRMIPVLLTIRHGKKHRVIKLLISIMAVFFLFWVPYNICLFLNYLKSKGKLDGDECTLNANISLAITVTEAFAYTHCCLNPIIYAFVGQRFRKRAIGLLKDWVPWVQPTRRLSDSSFRKSSLVSKSTDVTPTFIN